MRNPFRRKNLDGRFLPAVLAALVLLAWAEPSPRSLAIGAPLVALGLLVRTWAVGHLVKTERFTVTGPYAYVRHPLYLGTLAIGIGTAAMLGGWPGWLGVAVVATWFAASYLPRKERVETERLMARHGDVYARYRREVPALVPRLRAWRPDAARDLRIEHPTAECAKRDEDPSRMAGVEEPTRWRLERFDANNELGTVIAVSAAVLAVGLRASIG